MTSLEHAVGFIAAYPHLAYLVVFLLACFRSPPVVRAVVPGTNFIVTMPLPSRPSGSSHFMPCLPQALQLSWQVNTWSATGSGPSLSGAPLNAMRRRCLSLFQALRFLAVRQQFFQMIINNIGTKGLPDKPCTAGQIICLRFEHS